MISRQAQVGTRHHFLEGAKPICGGGTGTKLYRFLDIFALVWIKGVFFGDCKLYV